MSTMLEFAVILVMKRVFEWKGYMTDKAVKKSMRVVDIIDIVALFTFISLYILFNCVYWAEYLIM